MSITTIRRPAATGRRTLGVLRGLLAPIRRPVTDKGVGSANTPASMAELRNEIGNENLFAADELPAVGDIAAAAREYLRASEQARTADRAKRAARKLLDRLPAGRYGMWQVERVDNAREVADLETIRAIFDAHGLGEVPMKRVAPSLKVVVAPELANVAGLAAA